MFRERLLSHDLLRSFVAIVDAGGFARAADRLHLTQSAVSLQIKRLEEQTGQSLFKKSGRHMVLTEAGNVLLDYARRIVTLNEEAVAALQGRLIDGTIRLGAPQDIAEDYLPAVLQKFSASYPRVRLEVRVDRNQTLLGAIDRHHLDVAVVLTDHPEGYGTVLARPRIHWLAKPGFEHDASQPLPLALLEPPCIFREKALAALNEAGVEYRVAYVTSSLAGLRAAVEAGLGVTARIVTSTDRGHAIAPIKLGLPALKTISAALYRSKEHQPAAAEKLAELLDQQLRGLKRSI